MTVGTVGLGRGPDPAAVALDDAPGDRQRKAQPSPLVIERSGDGVVCPLYVRFASHDNNSPGAQARRATPPIDDDGAGRSLFTQDRPKKCRKGLTKAGSIAREGCPICLATDLYLHVPSSDLMHTVGHFLNEREQIERFLLDGRRAGVELRDFTELVDQRDHAPVGLRGLIDHLALPFAQRSGCVALKHAQVPPHDRRRRAKLVHGERKQPGIGRHRRWVGRLVVWHLIERSIRLGAVVRPSISPD